MIPGRTMETYYKLEVQGMVYLIHSQTADAYTYDLSNPVKIGKIIWTNAKAEPTLQLQEDWQTILQNVQKCDTPMNA